MTTVGLMSRPLRLPQAIGYLSAVEPPGGAVLIVADDREIDDEVRERLEVRSPHVGTPPSRRLATGSLRGRLRGAAGEGSWPAEQLERAARRLLWSMRYVDRVGALLRRTRDRRLTGGVESLVLGELGEVLGEHDDVTEIACFDVYDLPGAVRLADPRGIRVVVR